MAVQQSYSLGSQAIAGGVGVRTVSEISTKHRTEANLRPQSQTPSFHFVAAAGSEGMCSDAERVPNLSAVVVALCWIGLKSARLLQR